MVQDAEANAEADKQVRGAGHRAQYLLTVWCTPRARRLRRRASTRREDERRPLRLRSLQRKTRSKAMMPAAMEATTATINRGDRWRGAEDVCGPAGRGCGAGAEGAEAAGREPDQGTLSMLSLRKSKTTNAHEAKDQPEQREAVALKAAPFGAQSRRGSWHHHVARVRLLERERGVCESPAPNYVETRLLRCARGRSIAAEQGHQKGLSPDRDEVSPGPESRRCGRRCQVQGGHRGLRDSVGW